MRLDCPHCGDAFAYDPAAGGRVVNCGHCNLPIRLPMVDQLPPDKLQELQAEFQTAERKAQRQAERAQKKAQAQRRRVQQVAQKRTAQESAPKTETPAVAPTIEETSKINWTKQSTGFLVVVAGMVLFFLSMSAPFEDSAILVAFFGLLVAATGAAIMMMVVHGIDKLTILVKEHLDPDEEIVAVVMGYYTTEILGTDIVHRGIFAATEKRLVFYAKKLTGYDLEVFAYSHISSFEVGKGMFGHTLSFFASGNKTKMKSIMWGDIDKLPEYVRSQIGKKAASTAAAQGDVAEQIRRLSELREQGILTEEEFTAKKQELLARL